MEQLLPRTLVSIARDQFFSCYQMLETLVELCPNDVWSESFSGVPFWYQVYHTAYFVDYWLREDSEEATFPAMRFDPRIPPEFEWDVPDDTFISRDSMREYLRLIRDKVERVFAKMTEAELICPALPSEPQVTRLDAIFSQTRHVMYNLGYCNGILRARDLAEADWIAYNETEA
jgi:hypothetical protein